MKEIGEKLKEARDSIGISISEAAEDLKTTTDQLENLENGNIEAFKDVFVLKYFIRDYAKYLGLDKEDMIDEFNEYLFDYTSKISLDDIKKANKKEVKEENIVKSPYTKKPRRINEISPTTLYIIIGFIVIIGIAIVYFNLKPKEKDNEEVISYIEIIKGDNIWIYQIKSQWLGFFCHL